MKKFALAFLAALIIPSPIPAATDVSGRWSGFPIYLTLKQEGDKVSGAAGQTEDDQIPLESGSIDDDRLTLKFGPVEISLKVQDDQLSGELHQGEKTMKMVFRRIRPRDPSAPPPAFDAASLKPSAPQPPGKGNGSQMKADPGRLTCTNVSLKRYLVAAWGLKDYQISAPDRMNEARYDLTATMPAGTPTDEVLLMAQGLLTDRFRLVTHREIKELSVYALVVDRNGPKLKPAEGFGSTSVSTSPKGRTLRADVTMKSFAATLSGLLDKPVIDMTALQGGFHFDLEWAPDDLQSNAKDNDGASIFTALHQLGLKLESRKAPVEMLVVDHGQKIPAEN
jgi:uncharacterized protein (TIGR03435 family)